MVLAGTIVPDPVVVRELVEQRQPFLVCSLVDNRGVAEKVLPYYQRMVVAPDAQLVTLASAD